MTPLEMNWFLAERVMKFEFVPSEDGSTVINPSCGSYYKNHKRICYTWEWIPNIDWKQCMFCQEVVMREKPEEYLAALQNIVLNDKGNPSFVGFINKAIIPFDKIFLLLIAATQEQRVKAMVRCY